MSSGDCPHELQKEGVCGKIFCAAGARTRSKRSTGMEIILHGKIAVVTGAAGQRGRVIVRTLASCGADAAVHQGLVVCAATL